MSIVYMYVYDNKYIAILVMIITNIAMLVMIITNIAMYVQSTGWNFASNSDISSEMIHNRMNDVIYNHTSCIHVLYIIIRCNINVLVLYNFTFLIN